MEIKGRGGETIRSFADWEKFGKPAADYHWSPQRSAFELARDWTEGDAARRCVELLGSRPELHDVELVSAVAEKKTSFDRYRGGPRNHDLLIEATIDGEPLVIGVEGKADESFGDTLGDYRDAALKLTRPTNAPARLDALTRVFFDSTLEEEPELARHGYQLLSALAGTLADAKNEGAEMAVLLIHEFDTPKTKSEKHARNAAVLGRFLERIGAERSESGDPDEWITEPTEVPGDGEHLPERTTVFFAKLVTRVPIAAD